MKLTDKQTAFCQEYLIDLNATQAAIRAGYKEDNAGATGHENLKKPEIATRIQDLMEKRSKRTEITSDNVLKEIALLAFHRSDTFASYDSSGNVTFIDSEELTSDQMASIQSIESKKTYRHGEDEAGITTDATVKLKFYDKGQNLERLAKHLKLFSNDVVEANVNINITSYSDKGDE